MKASPSEISEHTRPQHVVTEEKTESRRLQAMTYWIFIIVSAEVCFLSGGMLIFTIMKVKKQTNKHINVNLQYNNNNFNFSLFLMQIYHMTSEDLQYSTSHNGYCLGPFIHF